MNKYELNKMDELINRLLDRDISNSEKSSILQELSKYPEYKDTLVEYQELQSFIQQDKQLLEPPAEFHNAVFSEIGKLSNSIYNKSFFAKNKYALIGLLLLFLTFTTYFSKNYFTDNKIDTEKQNETTINTQSENLDDNIGSNNTLSGQTQINETDIPITVNNEISESNSKISGSNRKKIILKNSKFEVKPITLENTQIASIQYDKIEQNTENKPSELNSNIELNTSQNFTQPDPRFSLEVFGSNSANDFNKQIESTPFTPFKFTRAVLRYSTKSNWLLQYRGLYALSNPEKSLQGRNFYFNSYCFGGFVEAYDGVYLGAEVGAEPYSQIYLDPNTDVQFEQTPNIFYFGIAGKFEFKEWNILGIHPSTQLFAGSSSLGPIVRTNLTLQYKLFDNIGMFFGAEGGMVFYSNQSKWYNSGKLGLIGGLNIKL